MITHIRYKTAVFLGCLFLGIGLTAQDTPVLSLTEAYEQVARNYPLIENKALLQAISESNMTLLNKEKLPTITLNGVGQLQSENVSIGAPGSPVHIDAPLETYKAYLEANFNIYDGGLVNAKKELETAALKANQQGLKVSLRFLKDRINALFFAIKLAREQQALYAISIEDIATNISVLQAGSDNGTVLPSDLAKLKVRKLELESENIKLKGDIKAYFSVLNALMGSDFSDTTVLKVPETTALGLRPEVTRPEQLLYQYQKEALLAQEKSIDATRMPKLTLFAQGGAGYPNPVNFADISNSPYALGGVRLNWNVFDWGKAKNERQKIELQVAQIDVDRKTFEFDITSRNTEFEEKMAALHAQIVNDLQITALQETILAQTKVQLQEGVINANDYILQVNAELSARQQLQVHQVQLQQQQIEYLTLFGKL